MNTELFKGEKLYSSGDFKLCRESYAAINVAIGDNQAVGIIAGYYDEDLTIAYVSEFFLHNLGYSYEEFMEAVAGSLKNVFCGENDGFIRNERLVKIHGSEDVKMLNKEGAPVKIRAYKTDSFDNEGTPLWILSAHIDEMQENMQLVNQVISSGFWSVKCDQHGKPTDVFLVMNFEKCWDTTIYWIFPTAWKPGKQESIPVILKWLTGLFMMLFGIVQTRQNMMWNTGCVWQTAVISGSGTRAKSAAVRMEPLFIWWEFL